MILRIKPGHFLFRDAVRVPLGQLACVTFLRERVDAALGLACDRGQFSYLTIAQLRKLHPDPGMYRLPKVLTPFGGELKGRV